MTTITTTPEVQKQRLDICLKCPEMKQRNINGAPICGVANRPIQMQLLIVDSVCPKKNW